jgi:taurine-pyruvate aminotransferase
MTYNTNDFDSLDVVANDKEHVWHHLTHHKPFENNDPLMIVKGEGVRVWDAKGNEYLDAVSGAVC